MIKASSFYQRESFLYLVAIITSILLSVGIDFRQFVVNPDGVCYLSSAEAMGTLGLHGAMSLCPQANWPFYSALIYGFVQPTHLSYPAAGYVLDGIFSALSVVIFILIVKKLGGSRRVLWLAASIILLSNEFNSVREYIIRDHGFWFFYLLSIFLLLHFFTNPKWIIAIAWSFSLFVATLFRVEGSIFLCILPFIACFCFSYSLAQRATFFFMLNLLLIVFCLVIAIWLFLHPQQTVTQLGRVSEVILQFKHGLVIITDRFESTKTALVNHILIHEKAKNTGIILFIVMSVWYVFNVMTSLSLIYAALVIYACWQRVKLRTSYAALVLVSYLIVNVAITSVFLFENLFLSKRYLVALCLIFMLIVPFGLEDLIQKSHKQLRYQFSFWLAAFFIVISALSGIFDFGYSKAYIYDAGKWIAENVPKNASLYANDYQMMYYSKYFGNTLFDKFHDYSDVEKYIHGNWKKFNYLAIRINKHDNSNARTLMNEIIKLPVLAQFVNTRGDTIIIFKGV